MDYSTILACVGMVTLRAEACRPEQITHCCGYQRNLPLVVRLLGLSETFGHVISYHAIAILITFTNITGIATSANLAGTIVLLQLRQLMLSLLLLLTSSFLIDFPLLLVHRQRNDYCWMCDIHTYIHTCVNTCIHTYIHKHTRTHAREHTHTQTYIVATFAIITGHCCSVDQGLHSLLLAVSFAV